MRAADAILDWTLEQPGNERVVSISPLVGETNDSFLNDIRARTLTPGLIRQAIEHAQNGAVAEGGIVNLSLFGHVSATEVGKGCPNSTLYPSEMGSHGNL